MPTSAKKASDPNKPSVASQASAHCRGLAEHGLSCQLTAQTGSKVLFKWGLITFENAKGFGTELRERINRPNPTNKKRLFKPPSPKGKVVPPAGTNNEPKQGAFNQKMNKPSKGRDNR